MTIHTKSYLGDKVFYLTPQKDIREATVESIKIVPWGSEIKIEYSLHSHLFHHDRASFFEEKIFTSKKDAFAWLQRDLASRMEKELSE